MASKCAAISITHLIPILLILGTLNISFCNADYVLLPGENLYTGNSLQYNNYVLTMQQDCNLVLYDSGYPVWATNTGGLASNCYCAMQYDGNLVVYAQDGRAIWASNTGRENGYYVLVLQKDRNLVIYGTAIWATATNAANSAKMSLNKVMNTNETGSSITNLVTSV
ncbi:hypothetical protein AQUCO_00900870v1 [Aquilegia coerulea]|uniref:Bulb-type lectin domain-containing protein n=1 Tax=Aquilegia coerulea TaxID=218851 RepID=A0A2G5EG87_AQUCA|nr:hypothetical protein AQUCO_00900870v1 [Aquilegia coerulea]